MSVSQFQLTRAQLLAFLAQSALAGGPYSFKSQYFVCDLMIKSRVCDAFLALVSEREDRKTPRFPAVCSFVFCVPYPAMNMHRLRKRVLDPLFVSLKFEVQETVSKVRLRLGALPTTVVCSPALARSRNPPRLRPQRKQIHICGQVHTITQTLHRGN